MRLNLLNALWKIGAEERLIPILIDELKSNESFRAKEDAIKIAGQLGIKAKKIVPLIIEILKTTEYNSWKKISCWALGEIGLATKEAINVLIDVMNEGQFDITTKAAEALGKIGAIEAINDIKSMLYQEPYQHYSDIKFCYSLALLRLEGLESEGNRIIKDLIFNNKLDQQQIEMYNNLMLELKYKDSYQNNFPHISELSQIIPCFKIGNSSCPKKIIKKEKQVFIAMPFKKQFREILNKAIKPCLEEKGYSPIKSDDEPVSMDLMCNICKLIRESKYAIVNISEWNANVMFELGLIWGMGKKAILLKDNKSKVPADISGMVYLPYEFGYHDKLKEELSKRIDSIFKI